MLSVADMLALEQRAVSQGVPLLQLMENAGNGFVRHVMDLCIDKRVVIFCGHGNNAGDGFVIARYLAQNCFVTVCLLGNEQKYSDITLQNFNRLPEKIRVIKHLDQLESYDVAIDALLGTGIMGPVREPIRSGIVVYNCLDAYKISVDVPSGINPDTGEIPDIVCTCDLLITFHDIKNGLKKYKEKTIIVDIGIPK